MPFTVGSIAAKDGANATITGGLLALDQTGSGPWILVHSLVDGAAGVNRLGVDSSGRLTANAVQSGTWNVGTLTTITNVVHVDDNAGSLTVDGTVTATIAAGATTIAKAEDAASADGDVGVPALAVRKATPANTSTADGDYEFLQMSAGRLWTNTLLGDGTNTIVLAQNALGTNDWAIPVMMHPDCVNGNGRAAATASAPIVLSNEDFAALEGRRTSFVRGLTAAMTGTTSTSLLSAPAASTYNYITAITVSNTHATVGTEVTLQDGNGGTAFWVFPAPAVFGGATINFNPPLRQPTAATALFCACLTTGSSTKVAVNGFTGA